MHKDVTLGRYCEKEGALHALNPLLKLCVLTLILISLFLSRNLTVLVLPLILFLIILSVSGLKISYVFRGFGIYFLIIAVFTFVRFALYHFTRSGAEEALCIALRLILIVLYSSVFACTTSADDCARAVEILLKPLRIFGINSRYPALVCAVALRFIPVLSDQASKLRQAQMSRCGLSYARSPMRFKAFLSILVPLFASSYRRSVELSMAMDSRCFSPSASTHLYSLTFSVRDTWAVVLMLIYAAAFVFVRFIWHF